MLYAIVVVIILILDQGLKYWTTVNLEVGVGQADLIPGIIHLTNIHLGEFPLVFHCYHRGIHRSSNNPAR
jgi:hypothetical protein